MRPLPPSASEELETVLLELNRLGAELDEVATDSETDTEPGTWLVVTARGRRAGGPAMSREQSADLARSVTPSPRGPKLSAGILASLAAGAANFSVGQLAGRSGWHLTLPGTAAPVTRSVRCPAPEPPGGHYDCAGPAP